MKPSERVAFTGPPFNRLTQFAFQRAESDATPVMVIALGERQAAVPLRSLQREFSIADDSPDGRMLGLIAEALEFVSVLHAGDELPSEVVTGEASWQPASKYLGIAEGKLRFSLLAWIDPESVKSGTIDPTALLRLETDPVLRARVHHAFEHAAVSLGLPQATSVAEMITAIAQETSYIESLREELLLPVKVVYSRIAKYSASRQGGGERQAMLTRLRGVCELALQDIAGRFAQIDAQNAVLSEVLQNASAHRSFIRANRDWLHRTRLSWAPILAKWSAAAPELDDTTWTLLNQTYQFLAPQFLPAQQWHRGRV